MVRNLLCYLRLFDCGCLSITHGTDVEAQLLLLVTLLEELLGDAIGPFAVEKEGFCGTCKVSTMNHVLKDLKTIDSSLACLITADE